VRYGKFISFTGTVRPDVPAVGVEGSHMWQVQGAGLGPELYRYCAVIINVQLHCYANGSKDLVASFVVRSRVVQGWG
jgi:hypothetical protein